MTGRCHNDIILWAQQADWDAFAVQDGRIWSDGVDWTDRLTRLASIAYAAGVAAERRSCTLAGCAAAMAGTRSFQVSGAIRDRMIADGWRQCAIGQRTTQFCAEAERIRADEREACANLCDEIAERNEADHDSCWSYGNWECAAAIRARGKTAQFDPEPDLSRCPNCGGVMDCESRANLNFCRRCQRA